MSESKTLDKAAAASLVNQFLEALSLESHTNHYLGNNELGIRVERKRGTSDSLNSFDSVIVTIQQSEAGMVDLTGVRLLVRSKGNERLLGVNRFRATVESDLEYWTAVHKLPIDGEFALEVRTD